MWNKLTHLVKRSENEQGNGEEQNRHNDKDGSSASVTANASVMSRVYEQHPNLSHFYSGSAIHLASPSPPVSPSKGSRRSLFKRSLKAKFTSTPVAQGAQNDILSPAPSTWTSPSPVNIVAKKVRASLQVDTFTAQSSITDPAPQSAPLPSQTHTPTVAKQHPDSAFDPQVEVQPAGTGSIRSILRDRDTPGTGRNVRFFSRDAYRVISSDVSELEIDQDDIPRMDSEAFVEKLKLISPERDVLHIPPISTSTPKHERSASPPRTVLSPDGTVFHSPMPLSPVEGPTLFHSFTNTTNECASATTLFMPNVSPSKDTNDTAFFTPGNLALTIADDNDGHTHSSVLAPMSTTPPVARSPVQEHSQEELVASLREQLSLQHQFASQFEIDLAARDELVSMLSMQLQNAEAGAEKYRKEAERRQNAMRVLRRKVGELETICRELEDEVERSREESFERSVMDEASEGALVVLHSSIGQLKGELEKAKDDEAKLVEDVNLERARAEQLTLTLQERTSKLDELEQERGYALDNVSRLENLLRQRDAEIEETQFRIVDREQEVEHLRAQMNTMRREHSRSADEQGRHLDELATREKAARVEMEDAVRQKAEDEVALGSIKERVATLTDEVHRLRKQVHNLQQESADKEVKLLQLNKARAQDKEDREGLNIALDSKQQELELLKRKLGVKGTGGSTPALTRVGLPDLASRRQSIAFATPSAPRPRPGSASTNETPLKNSLSSVRANTSTVKTSRVGMGLPPALRETPLSASTSSLARSTSSSKPRSALPVSHRRSSSVMSSNASHVAESDKENEVPVKTASRKLTMVPA